MKHNFQKVLFRDWALFPSIFWWNTTFRKWCFPDVRCFPSILQWNTTFRKWCFIDVCCCPFICRWDTTLKERCFIDFSLFPIHPDWFKSGALLFGMVFAMPQTDLSLGRCFWLSCLQCPSLVCSCGVGFSIIYCDAPASFAAEASSNAPASFEVGLCNASALFKTGPLVFLMFFCCPSLVSG